MSNSKKYPFGKYGDDLTSRQHQVLRLLCEGFGSKEIAHEKGMSIRTVEYYRACIRARLLADAKQYTNEQLGVIACKKGLV